MRGGHRSSFVAPGLWQGRSPGRLLQCCPESSLGGEEDGLQHPRVSGISWLRERESKE